MQAHDAGELEQRLDEGADGFKKWISKLGKQYKLKGKGLWMPVRIALTGVTAATAVVWCDGAWHGGRSSMPSAVSMPCAWRG